ncbi:MAG: ABC transporter substrate-binding protein [Schwartzia sp.]|nr:ABC transporter substrate-binding protein [Schwartzia sp. (in: firmicutes)]
MWKKKAAALLLAGLTVLAAVGCGGGGGGGTKKEATNPEQRGRLDVVQQIKSERTEDLIPQAQKEGKLVVYSITSRISKAAEGFERKYGIKVETSRMKDFELIDRVANEARAKTPRADVVICQDSGRVWGDLLAPGFVQNYVPASMLNVVPPEAQRPMVFAYMNKVIVYNNETFPDAPPITNLWQFTEPDWKGRFLFKSPLQEGINADFLTMLTKPDVAEKLAKAYEDRYQKKLELTTPNAGYEWIRMVFSNSVMMGSSDTSMIQSIGVKGQDIRSAGLLSYSKIRYAKTKNLAIAAVDNAQPLSGFYYPEYMLIANGAKHPAAAKLFIEYLLTEEGFLPWRQDLGTYSANPAIRPAEGDRPLSEWAKVLIGDDPQFIHEHRNEVESFVKKYI